MNWKSQNISCFPEKATGVYIGLGWPKSSFGVSVQCYGNPKELFGQPNIFPIDGLLEPDQDGLTITHSLTKL